MNDAANTVATSIPIERLIPPAAAPIEFTAAGYCFEHHPSSATAGRVILSHPNCPRLTADYGTRDCFSVEQAVQLILYVYQKEYQFK